MTKTKPNDGEAVVSPEMADALRTVRKFPLPFSTKELKASADSLLAIKSDPVEHPSHYANASIECWDAIKASMTHEAFCGYLKGNVQKYIWRYEKKEKPIQDLKKAEAYLQHLIAELSEQGV